MGVKEVVLPSDDYTSGKFSEVEISPARTLSILRTKVRITGNTAASDFGIFRAPAGQASLTNQEMADGEVYRDSALAVAADPDPELNVAGQPIVVKVPEGSSLYTYFKPDSGDAATTMRAEIHYGS